MNKFLPQIIAHRGASANAPENTLPAIKMAKDMGAKAVEIDVCLTFDKQPIVFHDYDLKRLFGKNLKISEMTYEQIRTYNVGDTFSEKFEKCQIPHLKEVLSLCNQLELMLDIELKPFDNNEDILSKIVCETINTDWKDNIFITSFSKEALINVRKLNKDIIIGLITENNNTKLESFFSSSDCQMLITNSDSVNQQNISEFNRITNQLYVYTVNTRIEADKLFDIGVKGIFTDNLSEFYVNK